MNKRDRTMKMQKWIMSNGDGKMKMEKWRWRRRKKD